MRLQAQGTDPLHGPEAVRLLLDHPQGVETEGVNQPLGEDGADPLDQAGAEVPLDADEGSGGDRLVLVNVKLVAVLLVVGPGALEAKRFAGSQRGQVPDDGGQVPRSGNVQAGHHVLGLFIDVGDPLDRPLEGGVGPTHRGRAARRGPYGGDFNEAATGIRHTG